VAFAAASIADQPATSRLPLAALAAALIGLSSEAFLASPRDRAGAVLRGDLEIAVAKDCPTVENTS
jgi:hypothetical protein